MQTKREALAAQGLAIAGARGKFSREANIWLDDQRSKGVKFSDDGPKPIKVKVDKVTAEKVDKPTGVGYPDYIFPSDYRYPEGEYVAYKVVNGKKVLVAPNGGMREVCNTCGVSLTNHGCQSPTIHGSISVTIEKG
jgi:hypothetical protein